MTRGDRKEARAKHSDPINFTCGVCGKVHPFDKDSPYDCTEGEDD